MKFTIKILVHHVFLLTYTLSACVKSDDFSIPKIDCTEPHIQQTQTVAHINALATDRPSRYILPDIISAYVVSTDHEKQFYQAIHLVTQTDSLAIKVLAEPLGLGHYTQYGIGKKVYLNLEGLYLQKRNGLLQIGSLIQENLASIPKASVKNTLIATCQASTEEDFVTHTSIEEILRSDSYIGQLIELSVAQFTDQCIGKPYNEDTSSYTDRQIIDSTGKTLLVRTHRQAVFSTNLIPSNSGTIKGIISKTGTTFYLIPRQESDIQLNNSRFTIEKNSEPVAETQGNLVFPGADFEDWDTFLAQLNSYGLHEYASHSIGTGLENSNALSIIGITRKNDYLFTAENVQRIPDGTTKLSFHLKGTSSAKSLSINLYKANGYHYEVFNLGTVSRDKTIKKALKSTTKPENGQADYSGTIDTKGQWVKITLDLRDVRYNQTGKENFFSIKIGSNSDYNLLIDDIVFEQK
ncbi:DUF5689 domain-containing protein [Flavobacterium sp. HSC-61S13]|uniref:DUF5689 domain-containing protein n=1 Tax=Flavobacterium sp. HSC-61S13 TaxID=2910963 RepID=UPI00209F11AE|nr:DUF5689 domain-containing protein [Flavobacterium sp. HSC-61S13]MCP1995067.1 hypothetical protein [Flavobacterium sp. HSC-61S13]